MSKGNNNYHDGLWYIPITKTSIQHYNYYSILNQTQYQYSMSSHQDNMSWEQNVANHVKTTSPRIMPSFLKYLSIVGDEKNQNDLEQIKN